MTKDEAITKYIELFHGDIPMPVKLDLDFRNEISKTFGFATFFASSVLDNFICKILKRLSC